MSVSADIPQPEMRRFWEHMHAPGWALRRRVAGASWAQVRAHVRRFAHAGPDAVLDAFEAGRVASFRDLKIVTAALAQTGDHDAFEAAIRLHDPQISFEPGTRVFTGSGIGGGSLNVYRIVGTGGEAVFEKIYNRKSACHRNMAMAYRRVLPRLRNVPVPALHGVARGEALAVARFERIDYRPRARGEVAAGVGTVRALAAFDPAAVEVPGFATRFDRRVIRTARATIHERLARRDPDRAAAVQERLERWQGRIAQHPRVFAHGDLNRWNISACGHVIDWDSAGFYPYGYDAACVACRSALFSGLAPLDAFFRTHFERPGTAREDHAAFLFFFVHFMQDRPRQRRRTRLFEEILAALERELG